MSIKKPREIRIVPQHPIDDALGKLCRWRMRGGRGRCRSGGAHARTKTEFACLCQQGNDRLTTTPCERTSCPARHFHTTPAIPVSIFCVTYSRGSVTCPVSALAATV